MSDLNQANTPERLSQDLPYVIERRKVGEVEITFVFCNHNAANMPAVANAVRGCELLAVEAPSYDDEENRRLNELAFTHLMSTEIDPSFVERAHNGEELMELAYEMRGTDTEMALLDINIDHPEHYKLETAIGMHKLLAYLLVQMATVEVVEKGTELFVKSFADASDVREPDMNTTIKRLVTRPGLKKMAVVAGANHVDISEDVGELVGESAKKNALALLAKQSYTDRLDNALRHEGGYDRPLLRKAVLSQYVRLNGYDNKQINELLNKMDDEEVEAALNAIDKICKEDRAIPEKIASLSHQSRRLMSSAQLPMIMDMV